MNTPLSLKFLYNITVFSYLFFYLSLFPGKENRCFIAYMSTDVSLFRNRLMNNTINIQRHRNK